MIPRARSSSPSTPPLPCSVRRGFVTARRGFEIDPYPCAGFTRLCALRWHKLHTAEEIARYSSEHGKRTALQDWRCGRWSGSCLHFGVGSVRLASASVGGLFSEYVVLECNSLRIELPKPYVGCFPTGKDEELIGVAELLARARVNPNRCNYRFRLASQNVSSITRCIAGL